MNLKTWNMEAFCFPTTTTTCPNLPFTKNVRLGAQTVLVCSSVRPNVVWLVRMLDRIREKPPHLARIAVPIERTLMARDHAIPELDANAVAAFSFGVEELTLPGNCSEQPPLVDVDPLLLDPAEKRFLCVGGVPHAKELEESGVVKRNDKLVLCIGDVKAALSEHERLLFVRGVFG